MDNETLYAEELEMEVPDHALKTLKRLWHSAEELRLRLVFVLVSVVFYTALSILSPLCPLYTSLISETRFLRSETFF